MQYSGRKDASIRENIIDYGYNHNPDYISPNTAGNSNTARRSNNIAGVEIQQHLTEINSHFKREENKRQRLLGTFSDNDIFAREYSFGCCSFGSKCNLKCFYCSQEYNPDDINNEKINFLPEEKIKKMFELLPREQDGCKIIGGIGSTIWTWAGEPLLHPKSLELLEHIRNEGFAVNSISTNGMFITEDHAKVLKEIEWRGVNRGVGLHMCNYNQTLTGLNALDKYEVPYHISIVPTRSQLDNGRIKKWIEQVQSHKPEFITILKPSYTKETPLKMAQQMDISDEELKSYISNWQKEYTKVPVVSYRSGVHLHNIMTSLNTFMIKCYDELPPHTRVLFLISESVKGIFEKAVEFKKQMSKLIDNKIVLQNSKVVPVENLTFGGNCNIAGLLMIDDYISAIDKTISNGYDPELIIMPQTSFWYDNEDLKGKPASTISRKYKINSACF